MFLKSYFFNATKDFIHAISEHLPENLKDIILCLICYFSSEKRDSFEKLLDDFLKEIFSEALEKFLEVSLEKLLVEFLKVTDEFHNKSLKESQDLLLFKSSVE